MMELSNQQEEFKKDLSIAITKAWEDEAFKNEFLLSPRKAVESLTGRKLNMKEDVNFVVTDQSAPKTFYLNIPNEPDIENMELNEDQLELVAGGCSFYRPIDCAVELVESAIIAGIEFGLETGLIE